MERQVVGARELRVRLGRVIVSQRAVTLPVRKGMAPFRQIQSRGRTLAEAVLEDRKDRF